MNSQFSFTIRTFAINLTFKMVQGNVSKTFSEPFLASWTITLKSILFLVTVNIQHYFPFDSVSALVAVNGNPPKII